MATNFNDAQTEPDMTPPPQVPPLGPTIPWTSNAAGTAGAQSGQTVPYPGPFAPQGGGGPFAAPTVANPQPMYPSPMPLPWPGATSQNAPTVVNPQPAPLAPQAPAWGPTPRSPAPASAPAPRARPASAASVPRTSSSSAPVERVWRLLPLPHILLGVGFILLLAGLNIPWGATAGGTLIYAQSFPIPFFSDQSGVAEQLAQMVVVGIGVISLALAGMNYVLTFLNWLVRPLGVAGCATALLMPLMLTLMLALLIIDGAALIFGAFDPLAGVALAPWQSGYSLNGAHAELGYYAWYTGVILNAAGMFTQPFVRR